MYVLIQLSALALLFRPFKAWSTFFYGRLMHILLIILKFCFLFFCIVVKLHYYVTVWSICVSALLQLLSGCRAIKVLFHNWYIFPFVVCLSSGGLHLCYMVNGIYLGSLTSTWLSYYKFALFDFLEKGYIWCLGAISWIGTRWQCSKKVLCSQPGKYWGLASFFPLGDCPM